MENLIKLNFLGIRGKKRRKRNACDRMSLSGEGLVQSRGRNYEGNNVTAYVVVTCLVAAMGGLIFGYDFGISGEVTGMGQFLKTFFPSAYLKTKFSKGGENEYCQYDDQLLTLFTSSAYLAALVASLFAASISTTYGRKVSMCLGGLLFLLGTSLSAAATNIAMLNIGRFLLGFGIGFANQSVPIYISEMAPAKIRGALNIGFQLAITIGILVSILINNCTSIKNGYWNWRISLALASIPALMMTAGCLFLPDTPSSILVRGHTKKAKRLLRRIRGTEKVDEEFQDLINASEAAKKMKNQWKNIIKPMYRPQLVLCILIPFFQQVTGINVIMFYAPVLFKTLSFGDEASIMSEVIIYLVSFLATFVSIISVDKFGRRILFFEGGMQMIVCQIAVGVMIGLRFGLTGEGSFSKFEANLILFFICGYVAAFAWSWGPLGWLVPSEICPLEIRSAGQAISVSVNMLFIFAIAQGFLSMLCLLKFAIFFFFAAFVIMMTIFVYFFVPETKKVPIEDMNRVWKEHWFWQDFIPDDASVVAGFPQQYYS